MNRDDIIRMAEEAGIPTTEVVIRDNGTCLRTVNVERFAALVAKAEREACARVCEEADSVSFRETGCPAEGGECAAAIRARGEK